MRFLFFLLLSVALVVGNCTTTTNQLTPPENYKGPFAAQPNVRQGDFWIYQRGDSTRVKSTRPFSNLHFPLWIGKRWRSDVAARRRNQPPTSTGTIPAWLECYVTAFTVVQVPAGSFEAFQCECECHVVAGEGVYQEGCGVSTIWYVPEVKNIIKIRTQSTASSLELLRYRISD